MQTPISAVVIDDTPDLRLLIRLTLERDDDFTVVGEGENGLEGIKIASAAQPQLVMLDLAMPVMDGLEALPKIKANCPQAKVVVLSGFEAGAMREKAMALGASAYLQKGVSPAEIMRKVREVLGVGEVSASRRVLPALEDQHTGTAGARRSAHETQLLNSTPAGLVLLDVSDADPVVLTANSAAHAMYGTDPAGLGARLSIFSARLARIVRRHYEAWSAGHQVEDKQVIAGVTHRVLLSPSSESTVCVTVTPKPDDPDATVLRQAIGTTAHEIRNPVTLLSGVAAIIRDSADVITGDQLQQLFAAVGRQADVLERVTEDLLTAAQVEGGSLSVDLREVKVAGVLEDALAGLRSDQFAVSGLDDAAVIADGTRLSQMVTNLLSNAVKYGAPPFAVEVAAATIEGAPAIAIHVRDHGAGVSADFRPRLFQEFARGEHHGVRGTGLGLYVVQSLAEAQGGTVAYAPNEGGGSVFTVTLPQA